MSSNKDAQNQGLMSSPQHRRAAVIASIIVFVNLMLMYGGTSLAGQNGQFISPLMAIGGVGSVTFFGMLILSNQLSRSSELNKGEIRKSITASILAVYFVIMSFAFCDTCGQRDVALIESIFTPLSGVVGVLVAFYFGSRVAATVTKNKHT